MKFPGRYSWTMPIVSGGMVMACLLYCRFWWKPHPMSLTDPDESIICWMFCSTLDNVWLVLGVMCALLSMAGGFMLRGKSSQAGLVTAVSGILLLPAGVLNIISIYVDPSQKIRHRG